MSSLFTYTIPFDDGTAPNPISDDSDRTVPVQRPGVRGGAGKQIYYAALAAFLLVLCSFGVFTSASAAPPSAVDRALFVRGFVAVPVGVTANVAVVRRREIALPNARVFLVRASAPTVPVASALTDLSGRFGIKTTERGVFMLCVEAPGFVRSCEGKEFALRSQSERRGTLLISPMREKSSATAYGTVKLTDGSKPRGFEPMMGVNAFATVNLKTASGAKYMGYVNNFGEYVVPSVPVTEDFALRVDIDKESRELKIDKRTNLAPQRDYVFDFEFRNSAPRIRLTSASANGKKVQIAAPGATITVKAVAEDRDADQLIYRWTLPDGSVVGPTNDPELKWTLPGRQGRHSLTVLVNDDRGGYVRDTYTVVATTGGVPFGGSVVDDAGTPIAGAQIDVNGRIVSTNTRGRFNYEVPVADTYVMTIRKAGIEAPNLPSYGTASYVYTGAMPGGKWTLRRAKVFTVDPTLPITVQHTRTEKDCVGPVGSRIDWTPYLGAGLIEWQDGNGNARALREIAKKSPADVQRVMRLLARNNAALANHMVKPTGVNGETRDTRLPGKSGIAVQIPANSLIDPRTGSAPAGKVQIAMSAIDLNASQMPGDFSATDTVGKAVSMESFGAGSIENLASDGKFDVACYVTNYGQPPANIADQTDADNAFTHTNPDATVAMEFSRVENSIGVNPEFPDDDRAVKFYVFNAQIPTNPPIIKADLDDGGERPVPQLCVTCHGGQVSSVAADPADPAGPKKGAFQNRNDIMSMRSNFLPFDLHYFNFPSGKSKAAQETAFKDLNEKIVKQVATDSGPTGAAIVELIEALYFGNSPTQLTDAVVTNWDKANPASDSNRFYRQVFGPACRTCHIAQPYTAPAYTTKIDFHADIAIVQNRVCSQKIMPHAKRTNELFWTSLAPNMPAYLQMYGLTLPGWDSITSTAQCGLFYETGATVPSAVATNVFPIFSNNCTGCHSVTGNANFVVSGGPRPPTTAC